MASLPKLESQVGEEWLPHRYPKIFSREKAKRDRLKIAVSEDGTQRLLQLASLLSEPFAALYVLVVPRGRSEEGRYQSPWMNRTELTELCTRFAAFWDQDARHHLWLHSDTDHATLVYDQHNVIFAYGPLDDYTRLLEAQGYVETPGLLFPTPHGHRYHAVLDEEERTLVTLPGWVRSPLQEGDKWA